MFIEVVSNKFFVETMLKFLHNFLLILPMAKYLELVAIPIHKITCNILLSYFSVVFATKHFVPSCYDVDIKTCATSWNYNCLFWIL